MARRKSTICGKCTTKNTNRRAGQQCQHLRFVEREPTLDEREQWDREQKEAEMRADDVGKLVLEALKFTKSQNLIEALHGIYEAAKERHDAIVNAITSDISDADIRDTDKSLAAVQARANSADAWEEICSRVSVKPEKHNVDEVIEELDDASPVVEGLRGDVTALLEILDVSENDWKCMGMSQRDALKQRMRRSA